MTRLETRLIRKNTLSRPVQLELPQTRGRFGLGALRSVVLLAGFVGTKELARGTRRIPVELPVSQGRRVANLWREGYQSLKFAAPDVTLRVVVDAETPAQQVLGDSLLLPWVEREPLPFRGTAGVLRDITVDYQDDDLILVATAAQVLLEPLASVAQELADTEADAAIMTNPDGTPGLMLLMKRKCLRAVPAIGFIDLKEQALSRIARDHDVVVVRRATPVTLPMRTLNDYIDALRHVARPPGLSGEGAFEERWNSGFAVVEPGADVHESAALHDAVVLAGGRVERGATVVRSVVGPDGVVGRNRTVIDQIVSGTR